MQPPEDLAPYQTAPDWWVSALDQVEPTLAKLKTVEVRQIGKSAGNRPIWAAAFGAKEKIETTANSFASAVASSATKLNPDNFFPDAFFGKSRRKRWVLMIQGAIHGSEFEGSVVALNLLHVLETGKDLRGKAWPVLQREGSQMRTVVVPFASPDGRAHSPVRHLSGASLELGEWITHGAFVDGTPVKYPDHKALWPLPAGKIGRVGGYFNDAGVNLEYDWMSPEPQPETVALKKLYLDERPDAALLSHTNAGSWVEAPLPMIPDPFQHQISRISGATRSRLIQAGFPFHRFSWIQRADWAGPIFMQGTGVYYLCGALPFVVEFPCGYRLRPWTLDQILDAGLTMLEEVYTFANRDGFRPMENWEKVRGTIQ